ncbi:MAG TPA: GNVR domain-containing protein [Smithella sp.]|nr:GNVR domain-containing protein [Smithella sp.]
MINSEKDYTIQEYIEILRHRIWYIVLPFLLIVIGASIYVSIAPKKYMASSLILVNVQSVPEAFVQATVTSKVEERLQSIAQEVMSRTRLEQIIKEFNLYEKEKKHLSQEEVIALMRDNIKVELPRKNEEKKSFTISYIGNDPRVVTAVTNKLASLFIEENLRIREHQAVGTKDFLVKQLDLAKAELDKQEAAVAQYKRRYMGTLPEQRDTNIKFLDELQTQYQRLGESLRDAQDRKLFIQKQLTDMESPISLHGTKEYEKASKSSSLLNDAAPSTPSKEVGGSYESQKESLTRALQDLRTKYTENYPDVIIAKKKLADLEKNKEVYNVNKYDPRYGELKKQLTMIDLEINRFIDEQRITKGQIEKYMSRVEQTPAREQDMASLLRQYQSTKDTYEGLLKKSQEAQQAENLEKEQKGEQFRIIDTARLPEKPFSPNIPKILIISLLAGIGSGLGLAFIREQMDRSFHDVEDVEISLGIKVLAVIPKIIEEKMS